MIEAHEFCFSGAVNFYVVGTEEDIEELHSYFTFHDDRGDLEIPPFLERLIYHDVYCFVKNQRIGFIPFVRVAKRILTRQERWISMDQYISAMLLCKPENLIEEYSYTSEELIPKVKNNPWIGIYEADPDDILKRLKSI